ncbi:hypothetical protein [Pyrococcus kukulkanii]|uniref:Uncharacterized protein n=1 Tax=Pyrococcus kukulkanii TaxID=1609559 RepID=A0A127BBI2_9EURY|nr:hypothetical protein [Pyrococcus kukulkanii]AMM54016.1 hypothetical protein TQ32_05645 [Pyrococcus kukulkanii]
MEEVRELKNVLERVEKKLIASYHVYTALIYSAWLLVMGGYLLLNYLNFQWLGAYWGISIFGIILLTIHVHNRYLRERSGEFKLGYAWIIAWILGGVSWGLLFPGPQGLAFMVSLGHIGMFISFGDYPFLIPVLTLVTFLRPEWALVNSLIIITYSLTALVNLYRVFRVI